MERIWFKQSSSKKKRKNPPVGLKETASEKTYKLLFGGDEDGRKNIHGSSKKCLSS